MADRGGARLLLQREAVFALVVALVMIAGAAAGVAASRQAHDDASAAVQSQDLVFAVGRFESDVAATVDDARRLASQVTASGSFIASLATPTSPVAAGVGFGTTDGSTFRVEGVPLAASALASSKAALELARDTAAPQALVDLPLTEGGVKTFIAMPAFRASATPAALATTDQRRADLLGYVLVGLDMDAIAERATRSGSTLSIAAATSSVGQPTRATTTLEVAGQAWMLSSAGDGSVGLSVGEVALLALAVAAAALVWAAGASVSKRRLQSAGAAESTLARLRLMTSLAPLVQEAVDLGQILPEIATRLRDELDLAGIGFAVPTPKGFRDIYVLGHVDATPPTSQLPETLAAGASVAIILDRGGRSVGVLRVRAQRALSHDELDALRAAAELATAAIVSGQLFEQQDAAIRALRDVDELKTAFLSTASHELRTPIAAIKGFASLLDDGWDGSDDADHRLYASRILANANSLDVLVQDLLDFSRLERGRLRVSPKLLDLTTTTEQVIARLSVLFADHELAQELLPTPLVLADREGVERIVTNLASNAVRYSPPGTTVTVRTAPSEGGAVLIIEDEGPGVPPSDREKVFARFFRGSGDAVIRTRGTGIGLAVVKEYVDQLGGVVSVDQAPTGGARFRVWLAATPAAEVPS